MTNRIQALFEQLDYCPDAPVPAAVEAASYSAGMSHGASHAFFAPLHYESNYAYPLLVWLHGAGGSEHQLKRIMPLVSMRNYVAVAPRGTSAASEEGERVGYDWAQSPRHISRASQRVLESIELASDKYNVAPNRIFLAGYGTGGTMAFRVAMQHPQRFAGALSLCGRFPDGQAPLARLQEARRVPLFISCGRNADSYGTEEVCRNLRLFHTAGMSVTLRQYPSGDELMPQMLNDMDRWIMEQINPPQPAETSELNHPYGGLN